MKIHPHALLCPIGAATAAVLVRGLPPETCVAAASAAATTSMMGPFGHALRGALVRNVWPGISAWIGVQLASWSEAGIGRLPDASHQVFATAMGATPHIGEFTDGLGESRAIGDGYHKRFASCQYTHAAIEALLSVRSRPADTGPDAIHEVLIETHPLALTLDNAHPETSLAGKFSLPHAAAALALGDVTADASSPALLWSPELGALRDRVRLAPYEPLPAPPHSAGDAHLARRQRRDR